LDRAQPSTFDVVAEAVSLAYRGQPLLERLSFTLPAGQCICLLGPSGVGKSSLLRLIAGLVAPGDGRIRCSDGRPLAGRLAWMGQRDDLLPWLTVLDNLLLGARLRGAAPDRARARDLLARVGLTDQAGQRPATLSGGQRQRAALARTLMEDRPVVLMDEPFSSLDAITRARLQALAAELLAGRSVLLVTHDPLEALRLGDRVQVMAGSPARIEPPICPPGRPPRPLDQPAVLALQGELLARLAAAQDQAA
jgi:putative hydroxymethylpyrimidine transport system ATP-binding protein